MTDPYAHKNPTDFPCPTCGAGVHEPCDLPDVFDEVPDLRGRMHAARERLARPKRRPPGKGRGSVREIPTAFESNRRRH